MRSLISLLLLLAFVLPAAPASATSTCSTAPDSPSGLGVVEEAYNLLSSMYVDRLPPDELLAPAAQAVRAQVARDTADPTVNGASAVDLNVAAWPVFADQFCAAWSREDHPDASDKLAYTAIRAMTRAVDEAHTRFLTPQMYRDHETWAAGDQHYEGIGTRLRANPLGLQYVFPGSPAEKAGLKFGDDILAIDGEPAADLTPTEAAAMLRGEAGTSVRMTVRRQGIGEPWDVDIARDSVLMPMIEAQTMGDVAYLRIHSFPTADLPADVSEQLYAFRRAGASAMILDLRGNPGGRLDAGTQIASFFLPPSTPVYRQTTRRGQTATMTAANARIWDRPMVVLVDEGTASMGEILAAALQEQGVATVLGTTTSGSVAGSVVVPLTDGSAVQVTTLRIDSGLGTHLNKIGVHPDVEVEQTLEDSRAGNDRPISAALDLLRSKPADQRPPQ